MLYETLQGAASQNPESLKSSEATLLSWETQPGFYAALTVTKSILIHTLISSCIVSLIIYIFIPYCFYSFTQNVISKHEFETNARFIAAIHLKNGIERHWKKVMNPYDLFVYSGLFLTICVICTYKFVYYVIIDHTVPPHSSEYLKQKELPLNLV